jgi:hypothetical protein
MIDSSARYRKERRMRPTRSKRGSVRSLGVRNLRLPDFYIDTLHGMNETRLLAAHIKVFGE